MKTKHYCHSLWAIALILGVISCSEQDSKVTTQPAGQMAQQNLTEIEIIEKQIGASLYKREIIATDESGKNTVTIRFASLNESLLIDYMRSTKYSITPVREHTRTNVKPGGPTVAAGTPGGEEADEFDYNSKVIVEVISKSLEPGAIGFSMNVTTTPSGTASNGRTKARVWAQMISPTWPEGMDVYNYTTDYIHYKLKKKNTTIDCCWGNYYFIYTQTQYESVAQWNIDGPYKVLIDLEWDNALGTYNLIWIAD